MSIIPEDIFCELCVSDTQDDATELIGGWTEINDFVESLSGTLRGRSDELGTSEAGSMSVGLDNSDGRFTPSRESSPYFPYILPERRFRVRGKNMANDNLATAGSKERSAKGFFISKHAPSLALTGISDTFARIRNDGWGTSDTGQSWSESGGDSSDYYTSSGQGFIKNAGPAGVIRIAQTGSFADLEITTSFRGPTFQPTGSHVSCGIVTRMQDNNNWYLFVLRFLTNRTVSIGVGRMSSGLWTSFPASSVIDKSFPITGQGQLYQVKISHLGNRMNMKCWREGAPEPVAWQISTTDSMYLGPGATGVYSYREVNNTNTTFLTRVSSITATSGETGTVEPSAVTGYEPAIPDSGDRVVQVTYPADSSGERWLANWYASADRELRTTYSMYIRRQETVWDPRDPFKESFTGTRTNGWGPSETGQTWTVSGGATSQYSVINAGGGNYRGRHIHQANEVRHFSYAGSYTDLDYTASIIMPSVATGGSIDPGILARFQDTDNFYCLSALCLTNGTVQLRIVVRENGTYTTLASMGMATTYAAGIPLHCRFQVVGEQLRGKVWREGFPEPWDWQVVATDDTFTGAGALGCHSNLTANVSNSKPYLIDFDDFQLLGALPDEGVEAWFGINWLDERGNPVNGSYYTAIDPWETEWTRYTVTGSPPLGAVQAIGTVSLACHYDEPARHPIEFLLDAYQEERPTNLAPNPNGVHGTYGWIADNGEVYTDLIEGGVRVGWSGGNDSGDPLPENSVFRWTGRGLDDDQELTVGTAGIGDNPLSTVGGATAHADEDMYWVNGTSIRFPNVGGSPGPAYVSRTFDAVQQISFRLYFYLSSYSVVGRHMIISGGGQWGVSVSVAPNAGKLNVEDQNLNGPVPGGDGDTAPGVVQTGTWYRLGGTITQTSASVRLYDAETDEVLAELNPEGTFGQPEFFSVFLGNTLNTNPGELFISQVQVTSNFIEPGAVFEDVSGTYSALSATVPGLVPGRNYGVSCEVLFGENSPSIQMTADNGQTGPVLVADEQGWTPMSLTFLATATSLDLGWIATDEPPPGGSVSVRNLMVEEGDLPPNLAEFTETGATDWQYPNNIFYGWVESWPASVNAGSNSEVSITVNDRLKKIGDVDLDGVLVELLQSDDYDTILPLSEDARSVELAGGNIGVQNLGRQAGFLQGGVVLLESSKAAGAVQWSFGEAEGPTESETALEVITSLQDQGRALVIPFTSESTSSVASPGGNGSSGTSPTDTLKTYTKTYYATWSRSYNGNGSPWQNNGNDTPSIYQGQISGVHGNTRSLIGFNFNQIMNDLAGATIKKFVVVMKNDHAYYSSGMTLFVGTHTYPSRPGSWSAGNVQARRKSVRHSRGATASVDMGVAIGNEFKAGTRRGISIGPAPSNSDEYYGYYRGAGQSSRPYIKVTYQR